MTAGLFAVRSGRFAVCPACGKKLCGIAPESAASGVELWCRRCKVPVTLKL